MLSNEHMRTSYWPTDSRSPRHRLVTATRTCVLWGITTEIAFADYCSTDVSGTGAPATC